MKCRKTRDINVPDGVYRPDEDSYLMMDAIEGLRGRILEIGCGSGIVSLKAAETADFVIGVDVNPKAVEASRQNALRNGADNVEYMVSDMFSNVSGTYDHIIFNPPYLPDSRDFPDLTLDGGERGNTMIKRFIEGVGSHLEIGGDAWILVSSINGFESVENMISQAGFDMRRSFSKRLFFEELKVFVFGFLRE
jgi:release factor glutamine methyltransferase